jgi:uncharacterized protein (DUF4415 family)
MKNKTKNRDIIFGNVTSTAEELSLKNAKVRVTMFIDLDIVQGYKFLAEQRASKYQTLMNQKLRDALDVEMGKDDILTRIKKLERMVFKPRKKGL